MRRKFKNTSLHLFLVAIVGSLMLFLFWLYSPPKEAVSVSPNPIPVINVFKDNPVCALIKSDRCVVLKFTRCKNTKAVGRVTTTLVGANVQIPLPTGSDAGERKCSSDLQYPVPVPAIAPAGKYHFHFRATYQVNPFRSIIQEYDTQDFEVL